MDMPIPDFGDVVGLRRLYRADVECIRQMNVPEAHTRAWFGDPIEKKPFFHALPGATALSFGMLGCDYHCAYCQNWFTSQAIRDPNATAAPKVATPEQIVGLALEHKAPVITSTYN